MEKTDMKLIYQKLKNELSATLSVANYPSAFLLSKEIIYTQ